MRRETQNVLLVLVGGALIKIVLDGTYLRYVKPWSGPVVLAAGVVLVLLAAVAIVRDVRGRGPVGGEHADAEHGSPAAWMMLLPVLAILLVAPPALGRDAVVAGGSRGVPVPEATVEPLPPGDAPSLAISDFVGRVAAEPDGPLVARDVTLTGFLVPARAPGSGTDLARLVISCCAADASPVRVHLDGPLAVPPAGREVWMRVRVRLVAGTGTSADGHVPTVRVVTAEPVPPPARTYEY